MMQLLNVKTGNPEDVADGDVIPALAAGTHTPASGKALVNPDGQLVIAPHADVSDNISKYGYTVPTQDQLTQFSDESKYGGSGANSAKAFAAGAARMPTFGLSDLALTKSGAVDPATLAGLKAHQPGATLAGEVAGGLGAMALAPEVEGVEAAKEALAAAKEAGQGVSEAATALRQAKQGLTAGDALNPLSAVSKVGGKLTDAMGSSAAARVLGSAGELGSKVIGSSIEGAVVNGLEGTISEKALGNPDDVAQRLIANMGMGALYGGGIGAIIHGGAMAIPKSLGLAKDAVSGGWKALFGDAATPAEAAPFFKTAEAVEPATEGLAATGTDGAPSIPSSPPAPTPPAEGIPAAGEPAPEFKVAPPAPPEVQPPPGAPAPGSRAAALADVEKPAGIIPRLLGKLNPDAPEAFANRGAPPGEVLSGPELAAQQKNLAGGIQDMFDTTKKALKDAYSTARGPEIEALLANADPAAAQTQFQKVKQFFNDVRATMDNRPALYPARFSAKVDMILEDMENGVHDASTAADYFNVMNEAKQALDKKIPWGKEISGEAADAVNLLTGLRSQVKQSLEDPSVWGANAARQAGLNNANSALESATGKGSLFRKYFMMKVSTRSGGVKYVVDPSKVSQFSNMINDPRGAVRAAALREVFHAAQDALPEIEATYKNTPHLSFDKDAYQAIIQKANDAATRAQSVVAAQPGMGFGGISNIAKLAAVGHFGGPIGMAGLVAKGAYGAVSNPEVIAAQLANIERAAGKTSNVIGTTAKALFRPVANAASKGAGVLKDALSPAEKLDRFKDRVDELQKRGTPEAMIDSLHEATKGSFDVAPKVTQALQLAALRGQQFLQSKVPAAPGPQLPFDREWQPSQTQIATFDRYHDAVHDPLSVLHDLKAGRVQPEKLEAVNAVYPSLMTEMKTELLSELAAHKAKGGAALPYQRQLALGQFLGQPLTSSAAPAALAQSQALAATNRGAQEAGQPQGGGKVTQGGLGKLEGAAGRMNTPFQQTITRERT